MSSPTPGHSWKIERKEMCKSKEFDKFFETEYDYLLSFAKSIDPKAPYEDLLHDCYGKIKDRIVANGFTGDTFLNFTRVTLMNTYKSNYRLLQKRPQVPYHDLNFKYKIENTLQTEREQIEQEEQRQNSIEYLNTMIYCYIDEKYNEKERFVFKTYYLLKPKKLNYRTLAEATGYSITTVSNIIKKMKKDLRQNLIPYINGTLTTGTTGN